MTRNVAISGGAEETAKTNAGGPSRCIVGLELLRRLKARLFKPVRKRDHAGEPVPCGDAETHWHWKDIGWPCPLCHRAKMDKLRDEDETRMAEKIAAGLARRMKDSSSNAKVTGAPLAARPVD